MAKTRTRRLTYVKCRNVIDSIVDLIECADTTPSERRELDRAADAVREIMARVGA